MYAGTDDEKLAFAREYLQCGRNAWTATCNLFSRGINDGLKCTWIFHHWLTDPVVANEIERLTHETDPLEFLPSKAETAREIYAFAKTCEDPKAAVSAFKLYCDMRGFIEDPRAKAAATAATAVNVQGVMLVPAAAGDWEARMVKQQQRLLDEARASL